MKRLSILFTLLVVFSFGAFSQESLTDAPEYNAVVINGPYGLRSETSPERIGYQGQIHSALDPNGGLHGNPALLANIDTLKAFDFAIGGVPFESPFIGKQSASLVFNSYLGVTPKLAFGLQLAQSSYISKTGFQIEERDNHKHAKLAVNYELFKGHNLGVSIGRYKAIQKFETSGNTELIESPGFVFDLGYFYKHGLVIFPGSITYLTADISLSNFGPKTSDLQYGLPSALKANIGMTTDRGVNGFGKGLFIFEGIVGVEKSLGQTEHTTMTNVQDMSGFDIMMASFSDNPFPGGDAREWIFNAAGSVSIVLDRDEYLKFYGSLRLSNNLHEPSDILGYGLQLRIGKVITSFSGQFKAMSFPDPPPAGGIVLPEPSFNADKIAFGLGLRYLL